ncbi:MAG: phosphoheptose isomerase [Armatimonadetes bacterium 55-13]|nr:MAG: phosphoheptose isomerase [Armatimonadetes bacterium 55-13]
MAESLSIIEKCLVEHRDVLAKLDAIKPQIAQAADLVTQSVKAGKTILLAGNGGSAADAIHIAGEFVGRFLMERRGAPAIALNTNDSSMTAIANDYGYEEIFARQIEAFGPISGVFIAYSTSGNSANILKAIEKARDYGLKIIGMRGENGGRMKSLCDVCLCAPSSHTPRVQEMHALIGHILCEISEPAIA